MESIADSEVTVAVVESPDGVPTVSMRTGHAADFYADGHPDGVPAPSAEARTPTRS
jgi:hypothetical protein